MSAKEREEFERYERVQQQQQQQQMQQQGYPQHQHQYTQQHQQQPASSSQNAGYYSPLPDVNESDRVNYNRGGNETSRQNYSAPQVPPRSSREKERPRVQQHVQSMVRDNDVNDPPPKYTP